MLHLYQSEFAKLLEKKLGILAEIIVNQITLAPENIEGDLAFPCFKIAKDFAKNPAELASELAKELDSQLQYSPQDQQLFSAFISVGPYINALIKKEAFAQQVITTIQEKKADYGR